MLSFLRTVVQSYDSTTEILTFCLYFQQITAQCDWLKEFRSFRCTMVRWYNIKKVDVLGFSTAYNTVYNPLQNSISCCFYYPCNTIMYTAQKHVGCNCSYSQYDKWVRFVRRPFYYSIILQCTANFTNTKFSNFTYLHLQKTFLQNRNVFC